MEDGPYEYIHGATEKEIYGVPVNSIYQVIRHHNRYGEVHWYFRLWWDNGPLVEVSQASASEAINKYGKKLTK